MVKFGRRLVSERHEEWAEYYIDYKVRRGKTRGRDDAAFGWGIVPSYPRPDHRFPLPASLDSTDTRAQSLKRLVYEAREDPTKVQAYVDGLKAEINKVGNTPLESTRAATYPKTDFFPNLESQVASVARTFRRIAADSTHTARRDTRRRTISTRLRNTAWD